MALKSVTNVIFTRIIYNGFSKASIKIYTKTGDKGRSSLYSGERRAKSDSIFNSLGNIDELSCNIGIVYAYLNKTNIKYEIDIPNQLQSIQCNLQDIGTSIATPISSRKNPSSPLVSYNEIHTVTLEKWIDQIDTILPELRNFILPSSTSLASAQLHIARAVCRRAERSLHVPEIQEQIEPSVMSYINRLSDYLFCAARYAALCENARDIIYRKPR